MGGWGDVTIAGSPAVTQTGKHYQWEARALHKSNLGVEKRDWTAKVWI